MEKTQKTLPVKVVVVGAGAAGIAAASKLYQHGFDVVVLEAEDRIGGRIHSHRTDHGWIELGAQWIHGEEHWLYDFAEQQQLLGRSAVLSKETGILAQNGNQITGEKRAGLQSAINEICDKLSAEGLQDVSYGTSIGEILSKLRAETRAEDEDQNKEVGIIYDWINRYLKIDCGADSLHDVSIQMYVDESCIGNYNHRLNFPYVLILDHLRSLSLVDDRFMPLDLVKLETPVCAIRMKKMNSGGSPVEVQTEDGETFQADHVIVTVSLGVLKKQVNKWFSPPLSQRKQDIIESMGFGLIGKVVLHYEEPFWRDWKFDYVEGDLRAIALYWDEEADALQTDPEGRYISRPWYRAIRSFLVCFSQPNTLIAFLAGSQVREMEQLPEEQVAQDLTEVLRTFRGDPAIPLPKSVLRSNWATNKNFCGTYSYPSTDSGAKGFSPVDLAEPDWSYISTKTSAHHGLVPGLLFAGEATHPKYFSMVHGAILSGWREADRLSELYEHTENRTASLT